MDITTRLNNAMAKVRATTGRDVWCIYLGRKQMRELMEWAERNGYASKDADVEGKNRPEYGGALVFQVNDDDHLNVS